MKVKYIVFDLDDTLSYEINFLNSAYSEIASHLDFVNQSSLYKRMIEMYHKKVDVFECLANQYTVSKEDLIVRYRNHIPSIYLIENAERVLNEFKDRGYKLGLITDGRSITQRNKLKALNIEHLFDKIIISEEFGSSKPNVRNYIHFNEDSIDDYIYVADNPQKDFVTPNTIGWKTICLLDKGLNIHKQSFDVDALYLPQYRIKDLEELLYCV